MGWFTAAFMGWATKRQRKELTGYVSQLATMDGPEIGAVLAVATHIRHKLESAGHMPMDPINYLLVRPDFALLLVRQVQDFQRTGEPQLAAGCMVWAHTARAAANQQLRGDARQMWRQLKRGFPHVDEAARDLFVLTRVWVETDDACQFPYGFTPDPL